MSNSFVTIIGNLTDDPEIVNLTTGTRKASFRVAVDRSYKKDDEWQTVTSFLNVVVWEPLLSDVERVLSKGNRIMLQGRLEQRTYEADDKTKRSIVEITASQIGLVIRNVESVTRRVFTRTNEQASMKDVVDLDDPW